MPSPVVYLEGPGLSLLLSHPLCSLSDPKFDCDHLGKGLIYQAVEFLADALEEIDALGLEVDSVDSVKPRIAAAKTRVFRSFFSALQALLANTEGDSCPSLGSKECKEEGVVAGKKKDINTINTIATGRRTTAVANIVNAVDDVHLRSAAFALWRIKETEWREKILGLFRENGLDEGLTDRDGRTYGEFWEMQWKGGTPSAVNGGEQLEPGKGEKIQMKSQFASGNADSHRSSASQGKNKGEDPPPMQKVSTGSKKVGESTTGASSLFEEAQQQRKGRFGVAVDISREHEYKKKKSQKLKCYRCLEFGHRPADCVNEPKCNLCGKIGHETRDCPEVPEKGLQ